MRIKDSRKITDVLFMDVAPGQCFMYGDEVHLKLLDVVNSVRFKDAKLIRLSAGDRVQIVNAHIVIDE